MKKTYEGTKSKIEEVNQKIEVKKSMKISVKHSLFNTIV